MKNYYEILEVDKNASKEVIDKAYKVLVKKYHPDLQRTNKKEASESKIKEINEAYDILSDELKRNEYNRNFKNTYVSVEDYNLLVNENIKLKNELNNIKVNLNYNPSKNNSYYEQEQNYGGNYNFEGTNYNNYSQKYNKNVKNSYKKNNYNINEIFNKKNMHKKNHTHNEKLITFIIFLIIILMFQLPLLAELLFNEFPGAILILIIFIIIIINL